MALELDLEKAEKDIEGGEEEVERTVALNWAARAVVVYQRYAEDRDAETLSWADDMYHEALEHSALSEDLDLAKEIQEHLEKRREEAVSAASKKAQSNLSQTLCSSDMRITAGDVIPLRPRGPVEPATAGDADVDPEILDAIRAQYSNLSLDIQELMQAIAATISDASNPSLILEMQKMLGKLKAVQKGLR